MSQPQQPPTFEPAPGLPNRCFACGKENAIGLQLEFERRAGGEARAVWTPAGLHEGWPGIVHGGLLSTVLDEAMSHAVLATGLKAMTAELRVRFREPAPSGRALTVQARVIQRAKRLVEAEASITGEEGQEYAHGWGRFLCVEGLGRPDGSSQG
jgi:uncharacterized protein (TIGR00369 family)